MDLISPAEFLDPRLCCDTEVMTFDPKAVHRHRCTAASDPKVFRPTAARRRWPTLTRRSRDSLRPKASHRPVRRPRCQVDSQRPAHLTTGPFEVACGCELLS